MTTLYSRSHIGTTKIAVLVNSPFDVDTTNKDVLYISRNFLVQKHFENNSIKIEPYPVHSDKDNYDFILWLAHNWFRDGEGRDISSYNGISIGNIIARRLMSAFANDFRNYLSIKKFIDDGYSLLASSRESNSFKRVSKLFKDNIDWYKPQSSSIEFDITSDPERTVFYQFPNIHPLSGLARLFQRPFLNFVKRRSFINISDWSSINQFNKRNDTLIFNSLKPWKGFYLKFNKDILNEANNIFPKNLEYNILNPERINNLIHNKWNQREDIGLANHFCKLVDLEYQKGKEIFKKCFAVYKEALNYYEPKTVVIPGETHFGYVIIAHLAKTMKIKTILCIDGYQLVEDDSLFYKRRSGNHYIFDKFLAFGSAHKDLMINSGVKAEDCILSKSPLLSIPNKVKRNVYEFNAIIMCYHPKQLNPDITWDKKEMIVLNLIEFLQDNDFSRIAIKIKDGSTKNDTIFFEKLFTIYEPKHKVDILTGPMSDHISKTELVIGQFSTAIFECSFSGVPYYVYEPHENGKNEDEINSAKIFNRKSISRNIKELSINIQNKTPSVTADRKIMFEGPQISQLDLDHFIN